MNFVETTITLTGKRQDGKDFTKTYPGKVLEGSGLGYWIAKHDDADEPDFYALTHILSGYRLSPDPFFSEEIAQQLLRELASMPLDWDRSLEELFADPTFYRLYGPEMRILFRKYRIEDAAATAMGGRV